MQIGSPPIHPDIKLASASVFDSEEVYPRSP